MRVHVACPDPPARSAGAATRQALRGFDTWLAHAAPASARGELCVALVSDRRMRALNRQFRGHDRVTDVLSFPAGEGSATPARAAAAFIGDIVIAAGVAKRQAKEHGHSLKTEVQTLALHGLLHLLGYDHETDDGKMARAEARLRKRAGLPEGVIERAPSHARPSRRAAR